MSKLRAVIISCVLVVMSTALMGGLYIFSNISYSLPDDVEYAANDITINNIEALSKIDTTRVSGPKLIGNDIDLSLDLYPNEEYVFRYDITNLTDIDYYLKEFIMSCTSDVDVNNHLTIEAKYDNGEQVLDNSNIPSKTKRTVYITIKYDKNEDELRTFDLRFDMLFEIGYMR